MSTNSKVDAYIAKSREFARPIMEKIRRAFHAASPDIEETMKWSAPHFEHRGLLAGMAAFKEHGRFSFWKGKLMKDPEGFSPSSRREYVEWIEEAKREASRAKRLASTIEWLAEGKTRHWKYQR